MNDVLNQRPWSKGIMVALGECYRAKGEFHKAEEYYKNAVDNDPIYAPGLIGMARVTLVLGKEDEHREWIEKAYHIAPANPYVRETYLTLMQLGDQFDPNELIRDRERSVRTDPDNLQNRLRLGLLYEKEGQFAKAEEIYLFIWEHPKAIKLVAARVLLSLYGRQGRYDDGDKIAKQLIETSEDKPNAYALYAEYLSSYDWERAKSTYEKIMEIDPARGNLLFAHALARRAQWAKAADAMKTFLEVNPDSWTEQRKLAGYLIEAGQYDQASDLLKKLLESDPLDAQSMVLRGVLARRQKQFDLAEQFFTRAINENPKSPDALYRRAVLYFRDKGELTKAQRDLETARKLSTSPQIAMDHARVMAALGDRGGAQLIYSVILRDRPTFAPAIQALLDQYLKAKRWTAMEALISDAKGRFPKDPSYSIHEAAMWQARRDPARSLLALEAGIEIDSQYLPTVETYIKVLIGTAQYDKAFAFAENYTQHEAFGPVAIAYQGLSLMRKGAETEADEKLTVALDRASSDQMESVIAQIANSYGPLKAAQRISTWCEKTNSTDARVYLRLAPLYLAGDNYNPAKAIEILLKARELASSNELRGIANRELGWIYHIRGSLAEAEAAYVKAIEALPKDPRVMNNLAYLYTENLNQPAKALPLAREAVKRLPTDANVVDTYGWTLAKLGKLREAEEHLLRSARLAPDEAPIRYHLGWIYEQKGRLAEAEIEYRRVQEIIGTRKDDDPLGAVVSEALERVRENIKAKEQ